MCTVCMVFPSGGGTGAVLLIPEAIILGESGSQGISFPSAVEWYFNLIAELGRQCIFVETYTGRDHWQNTLLPGRR